MRTSSYLIAGEEDVQRVLGQLGNVYACAKESEATETLAIYDTFDWRLFRKSLVLFTSDDFLCVRRRNEPDLVHRVPMERPPVFLRDLPDGELKSLLAPILGPRALMKLVELVSETTGYRLVNAEGKIVARLAHERARPLRGRQAPPLAARLWLRPVRGYRGHFRAVAEHLEEAGLTPTQDDVLYEKGLEFAGKMPGDYSTKINPELHPDMRADLAAKEILRMLVRVIRINEAELEKDVDTGFLHDFRVAIRRTRTALGQVPAVFPARIAERFKKDFSFAGKLTNALRDLDVWLLQEESCKAKLAPSLREAIGPVFARLREERTRAFGDVVRRLKSRKFRRILKDWEEFLSTSEESVEDAPNAAVPVGQFARKRIHKRYRRVLKAGRRALGAQDDEMLHALRIQCKKLRYLMEFFSSVFPREKTDVLIRQVTKLHDTLGSYNDLRNHEDFLLRASRASSDEPLRREALLAIGNLVGVLDSERRLVKDEFLQAFAVFASPELRERFDELFGRNAGERHRGTGENP